MGWVGGVLCSSDATLTTILQQITEFENEQGLGRGHIDMLCLDIMPAGLKM